MTEFVTTQQVFDALVEIGEPSTLQQIVDYMTPIYPNHLHQLTKKVSSSLNTGMIIGCVKKVQDKYEMVKDFDEHLVSSDEKLEFTESGFIVNNEVNANESTFSLKTVTSAHPGCWGEHASSSCSGQTVRILGGADKASVVTAKAGLDLCKEVGDKQQRPSNTSPSSSSGSSHSQELRK